MIDLEKLAYEACRAGRIDANETLAFARQFEHVMTEVQLATGIDLAARRLFPTVSEVESDADTYTYRQLALVGKAKIGSLKANDIPTVGAYALEFPAPVRNITAGYIYDVDQIAKAARLGINVDTTEAMAARQAINEVEEEVAFNGDAALGVKGLFTAGTGITAVTKVSVRTWDDAAVVAADIIADVDGLRNKTWDLTRGKDPGDTLVLGTAGFRQMFTVLNSPTFTTETVGSALLKSRPWLKAIEHAPWLDDLGASAKERQFLYKRDPSCIAMVIPLEFTQMPPEAKGFTYHVACRSKTGGVMIRKPKSIAWMDGTITAAGLTGGSTIG